MAVGVDTIRVRGRVDDEALQRLPRQRHREDHDLETGEVRTTATSSTGKLTNGLGWSVDVWRHGRTEAVFEASVPRVMHGDNRSPATVEEVRQVLTAFYTEVAGQVTWQRPVDKLELLRLDLVRTFTGDESRFGTLLDALERLRPKGRVGTHAWRDRSHAGVQTLTRETTRWRGSLYQRAEAYSDKARGHARADAERLLALAKAESGRLRFEIQLKSAALQRAGLLTVADLEPDRLIALARYYFQRCRFDARIGGDGGRLADAMRACQADGTYVEAAPMLGTLMLEAAGFPSPYADPRTRRKYAGKAASLGLVSADLIAGVLDPMLLDWTSARVLTGLAAVQGPSDPALAPPGPAYVAPSYARTPEDNHRPDGYTASAVMPFPDVGANDSASAA